MDGIESTIEGDFLPLQGQREIILIYRNFLTKGVGIYPFFFGNQDTISCVFALVQVLSYSGSTLERNGSFLGETSHKYGDIFHGMLRNLSFNQSK